MRLDEIFKGMTVWLGAYPVQSYVVQSVGHMHVRAPDPTREGWVVELNIDALYPTQQAATEAAEANYQARRKAFGRTGRTCTADSDKEGQNDE